MSKKILILPGDGIGPEIMNEATKVLDVLQRQFDIELEIEQGLIGGSAIDAQGSPLPDETINKAKQADAILLGAVGGPKWDHIDFDIRPEKGLLGLRSQLELFANLRPAILFPQLTDASSLKPEVIEGLDILIVRELTGGIYFGEPRGIETLDSGERIAYNTLVYKEHEIERIVESAFEIAGKRNKRVCSVDKANVLEVSQLWREVVVRIAEKYPDIDVTHMYVDNAAMQLVRDPNQFDVLVTSNLFGDILSDCAAMLTGSIGMLPSASLNGHGKGVYEPVHGSAPDIAGENIANPLAMILSVAMMLRYSFGEENLAHVVEKAVKKVLVKGYRCADIYTQGMARLSTVAMGDAVVAELF